MKNIWGTTYNNSWGCRILEWVSRILLDMVCRILEGVLRQGGKRQGREAGREGGREAGREVGREVGRQGGREGGRDAGRQGGREQCPEHCQTEQSSILCAL